MIFSAKLSRKDSVLRVGLTLVTAFSLNALAVHPASATQATAEPTSNDTSATDAADEPDATAIVSGLSGGDFIGLQASDMALALKYLIHLAQDEAYQGEYWDTTEFNKGLLNSSAERGNQRNAAWYSKQASTILSTLSQAVAAVESLERPLSGAQHETIEQASNAANEEIAAIEATVAGFGPKIEHQKENEAWRARAGVVWEDKNPIFYSPAVDLPELSNQLNLAIWHPDGIDGDPQQRDKIVHLLSDKAYAEGDTKLLDGFKRLKALLFSKEKALAAAIFRLSKATERLLRNERIQLHAIQQNLGGATKLTENAAAAQDLIQLQNNDAAFFGMTEALGEHHPQRGALVALSQETVSPEVFQLHQKGQSNTHRVDAHRHLLNAAQILHIPLLHAFTQIPQGPSDSSRLLRYQQAKRTIIPLVPYLRKKIVDHVGKPHS